MEGVGTILRVEEVGIPHVEVQLAAVEEEVVVVEEVVAVGVID